MYQEPMANKVATPLKESSFCETAYLRLEKINDSRDKVIYEIEEKIHSIYNQRVPVDKISGGDLAPMEQDFFSKLHRQIGRSEEDNFKLSKILDYLNRIV